MPAPKIQPFAQIVPMIYAYTTPGYPPHDGWIKIGYAERQDVLARIKQQLHTADIDFHLEWQDNAMYKDGSGEYFKDHDFHSWLVRHKNVPRKPKKEWFQISPDLSQKYFGEFTMRQIPKGKTTETYALRREQEEAVTKTKAFFASGGKEFLWNAKPRFGKTLTAYDLVRECGFKNVLILTNRPSIANSWVDDFHKFIGWRGEYAFVSDTGALAGKDVWTREEYAHASNAPKKLITFESLQGLKGSLYFGGQYDKLKWLTELRFDLVIIDESHEGVDTEKTDFALENLHYDHLLYLSGTPFRQLASAEFSENQIFNWSYADEQEAKEDWNEEEGNPYSRMPKLSLFTYKMSDIVREKVRQGIVLDESVEAYKYAFDLNEFFATHKTSKKFVHEEAVRQFLTALATQKKFPFSTPELRTDLAHTLWYLERVDSAKALKKLLEEDETFSQYKIILATGDGTDNEADDEEFAERERPKVIDRVRSAIKNHDRTITLTVGQLTVGVTIPEWTGVLMLCNMKSPAAYMQAAFRSQNPYEKKTAKGNILRKENAYIFDFDPARSLEVYEQFASNLTSGGGTGDERKNNVRRLLNFLPVIGEDEAGEMVELDAEQVLVIPRRLKSRAVIECRFMSNYLFQNIGNIFAAPRAVAEIISRLQYVKAEKGEKLSGIENIPVNEKGEIAVDDQVVIGLDKDIFGEKIYEVAEETAEAIATLAEEPLSEKNDKKIIDALSADARANLVAPVADAFNLRPAAKKALEKQVEAEIASQVTHLQKERDQKIRIAEHELRKKNEEASSSEEVINNKKSFEKLVSEITETHKRELINTAKSIVEEKHENLVRQAEIQRNIDMKREKEEEMRGCLRGFSRTIPSFLMAYGDDNLTLANFDKYVDENVFKEVTGISLDDFRFLRDGGNFEEEGIKKYFNGKLFDEIVFNDSIKEFLHKKRELANYFDENQKEDIFDYIPPQKTNQIFTPRWVVAMMVDNLEKENPGCFDDPDNTFADLYMKSGLYITEIVKRLYKSEGLKRAFPDEKERIRHILEKQVYGIAPTRIIYLIATNYILGFDDELKEVSHNFVEADTVNAAKEGNIKVLLDQCYQSHK